ncbi:MAG: hypothetical protein QNJ17_16725 [Desulfocapsaceae bacterium]|nr:hypothetical protein [Desulfocapsaceae bacterium]
MYYNMDMDDVCDICGGTGQIGIFRGLSRFIMTYEECPECYGTGMNQNDGDEEDITAPDTPSNTQANKTDGPPNKTIP